MTGYLALGEDEVIELGFALFVIARDTHDIFAVLRGQIAVFIDQCLTHALCVVDIFAEDDGFVEAVGPAQEFTDLMGDQLGALLQHQGFVEILLVVDAVFDLVAVLIHHTRSRVASRQDPCRDRCARPCRGQENHHRSPARSE